MTIKRIAIFGGSYNPVHNAHIQVGKYVAEKKGVDEVWIMLSPQNPFKAGKFMLDDNVRLRLLQESFANVANLKVSEFELHLPRPSYTYKTLEHLKQQYPDTEFSLVFGIDILEHFMEWRSAVKIIEQHKLMAYLRPGYEENLDTTLFNLQQSYNARKLPNAPDLFSQLEIIKGPWVDISSTQIWEKVRKKEEIGHLVPECVTHFLKRTYY